MRSEVVPNEEFLVEVLSALAATDGSVRLAVRRLHEQGRSDISAGQLTVLRERHAGMYQALAVERASAQEEAMAQEYRELVRLGQRATRTFLEDLNEKLEDPAGLSYDMQRQLPQIIQAITKVQQVGTDKLLALTGRPTDGGSGDVMAGAELLVKLGVLKPVERPSIEGTAEEVQ
jgi:hypothetical protein